MILNDIGISVACGQCVHSLVSILSIHIIELINLQFPEMRFKLSTNEWVKYWRLQLLVETQLVAEFHCNNHGVSYPQSNTQHKNNNQEKLTVIEKSEVTER